MNRFVYLLILLGLIALPLRPTKAAVVTAPAHNEPAFSVTNNGPSIQVQQASFTGSILVSGEMQTVSCNLPSVLTDNLVQSALGAELNQATNCFQITFTKPAFQNNLFVTRLPQSPQLVVTPNSFALGAPQLQNTQSELPLSLPVSNSLISLVLCFTLILGGKKLKQKLNKATVAARSLTLAQLQILRC